MVTLTCCLRFADGESVSAEISANSLLEDAFVSYQGPVQRLPVAPVSASGIEMKAYFKSFARELNAKISLKVDEGPLPTLEETAS
jgi:hypothetical protein